MNTATESRRAIEDAMRAANAVISNLEKAISNRKSAALTAGIDGDTAAATAAFNDAKELEEALDMCMGEFDNAFSQARIVERRAHGYVTTTAEYAMYRPAEDAA